MRISVSAMRDWLKCPQYAHNIHIAHRGPEGRPVPLDVGTLFHEAMARRLGGDLSLGPELKSWLEVSEEAREKWSRHRLWLPVNHCELDPAWTVLGTEVVLEASIGYGHTLVGTLDAPIVWNGKLWSGQWKTYDGGPEPAAALLRLLDKVRLSYHEVAYQWLAEQTLCKQHNLPYGGVILGACEKLPGYRVIDKKRVEIDDRERVSALSFHFLLRLPGQQRALWLDTHHALTRAARDAGYTHQWKNLDYCFGQHGRTRCPFFSVCHEGGSLDDPKFIDYTPRY